MGTTYGMLMFHEEFRRNTEMVNAWMETFNLKELPSPVTRKPSLADIRHVFRTCYLDLDPWDELTDERLLMAIQKNHPTKARMLLLYIEMEISQKDINDGFLTFDRCPEACILTMLVNKLGPVGVFNYSTMELGIVLGSENVEEALATANGTVGWINHFARTLDEAVALLTFEYLDSDDTSHPECYLGMSPVGCLNIFREGTDYVVQANIYGVFNYKSDPEQVRFERVLRSAHFRPTNQKGTWDAVLSREALLDLISSKFRQFAFASPIYYETHPEYVGIEITLKPPKS